MRTTPQSLLVQSTPQELEEIIKGNCRVLLFRSHPSDNGTKYGKKLYLYHDKQIIGEVTISATDMAKDTCLSGGVGYAAYYYEDAGLTLEEAINRLDGADMPAAYFIKDPVKYEHPVAGPMLRSRSWIFIPKELEEMCEKTRKEVGA